MINKTENPFVTFSTYTRLLYWFEQFAKILDSFICIVTLGSYKGITSFYLSEKRISAVMKGNNEISTKTNPILAP